VIAGIESAAANSVDNIPASAMQALNALDNDFFLPFSTGIIVLVLATSLITLRGTLLPRWLGWVGIVLFVVSFTPVGFVAFGLSGIWIIVVSILLYLREETGAPAPAAAGPPTPG
jgi:membrane-bound ClpP family serine protease